MIDPKELRIGNIVGITKDALHAEGSKFESAYFEIESFEKNVVHFKGFYAGEYFKDLKPIQLTMEWLLDNGFKHDPDYGNWQLPRFKIYTKGNCHIGVDEDGSCVWYFAASDDYYSWYKKMPYVHTLQNFHFCYLDEELELKPEL